MIRVTIWNEYWHEQNSDRVAAIYPKGIHDCIAEFLKSDDEIMFLHVREPMEIEKFVRATENRAKTLLIRGGARTRKDNYGNQSDDGVENYSYDYYYVNEKTLDVAETEFVSLLQMILRDSTL